MLALLLQEAGHGGEEAFTPFSINAGLIFWTILVFLVLLAVRLAQRVVQLDQMLLGELAQAAQVQGVQLRSVVLDELRCLVRRVADQRGHRLVVLLVELALVLVQLLAVGLIELLLVLGDLVLLHVIEVLLVALGLGAVALRDVGGVPLLLVLVELGDLLLVLLQLLLVLLLQVFLLAGRVVFVAGVRIDHRDGARHLAPVGGLHLEPVELDGLRFPGGGRSAARPPALAGRGLLICHL